MTIESLTIVRFGGLNDLTLDFGGGVNIIEGPNESGKSTVAAFIRYILYGFRDKEERLRVCGSAGVSGSILFLENGERVRVERSCGEGGESVRVLDPSDGRLLHEGDQPGELLLGVPAAVYDRTAGISQDGGALVEGGVGSAIENLLFSADESVSVPRAVKRLEEERVALRHKNGRGGRIDELTAERDALKERLDAASALHESLFERSAEIASLREKIEKNRAHMTELEVRLRRSEDAVLARQVREIQRLQSEAKSTAAVAEAADAALTRGVFTADADYLQNIDACLEEMSVLDQSLAEAQMAAADEAARKGVYIDYNFNPGSILTRMGGEEMVTRQLKTAHRSRVVDLIAGGICAGLTVAAAFFGCVLRMAQEQAGRGGKTAAVILGCAGASLIAALTFFILSVRARRREESVLNELGVSDVKEYDEMLPSWLEMERKTRLEEQENTGYANAIRAARRAVDGKAGELRKICDLWSQQLQPDEVRDEVKNALDAAAVARHEAQVAAKRYAEAENTLSAYSPEELEERVASAPDEKELAALGTNLRRDYDYAVKSDRAMSDKLLTLEKEYAGDCGRSEHPAKIAEAIADLDRAVAADTARADALELAVEKLKEASASLRSTVAPSLTEWAGGYLSALSGGKYDRMSVDGNLGITWQDSEGMTRAGTAAMSAGTADIAYIALRLALLKLLYRGPKPTLVIDETFCRLDDDRLRLALETLRDMAEKEGVQSIILTSQKREGDVMDNVGPFDYMKL